MTRITPTLLAVHPPDASRRRRQTRSPLTALAPDTSTSTPLDRETVLDASSRTELVVTIEDHRAVGGLGGAIWEVLAEIGDRPPVRRIGVPDIHYDRVGGEQDLLEHAGINAAAVITHAVETASR